MLGVCSIRMIQSPSFLAYQAEREGFGDAAAMFRDLAQDERRSLACLLATLRSHLDVTQELASKERTP